MGNPLKIKSKVQGFKVISQCLICFSLAVGDGNLQLTSIHVHLTVQRAGVGYELAMIISHPTSASEFLNLKRQKNAVNDC